MEAGWEVDDVCAQAFYEQEAAEPTGSKPKPLMMIKWYKCLYVCGGKMLDERLER